MREAVLWDDEDKHCRPSKKEGGGGWGVSTISRESKNGGEKKK